MPAFIGLPGAREKTEIGRGLFERSEFRSPRRRAKREAGIPDNERATFLGYFFAAGKKLQNDVILTTARRKNLLPSVTASQCNVILKGFALKNLPATACMLSVAKHLRLNE